MNKNSTLNKESVERRSFLKMAGVLGGALILGSPLDLFAQNRKVMSIATGGTGGVWFPVGGAIASLLSKHLPGVQVTAEVTAAAVENCLLLERKKVDMAFALSDVAHDAAQGKGRFKKPIPLRTLFNTYISYFHIVTLEGKGINSVADLKGKRISVGAPNSATEGIALRILEAYGLNPEKDVKKDRLGVAESAGALKDGKIDAFMWQGGVPTAAVMDLAASPGVKAKLIEHQEIVPKMVSKYGPVYTPVLIPKGMYSGIDHDTKVMGSGNPFVCLEEFDEKLAYDVVKTVFNNLPELHAVHKEARNIGLKNAVIGSPVPFHKGALRFFKEKGITVK